MLIPQLGMWKIEVSVGSWRACLQNFAGVFWKFVSSFHNLRLKKVFDFEQKPTLNECVFQNEKKN